MTTLRSQDLKDYLGKLKLEVKKLNSSKLHSEIYDLIEAEEKLYNYFEKTGAEQVLAFSGNGLFSVDSLKADLETMCKLDDFKEISEKYQRGIKSLNEEEILKYQKVSEKEFKNEKKIKGIENLMVKQGFEFNEDKEGKFELKVRDSFYVDGIDEYSKKYPVMFKEKNMKYQVIWNNLFFDLKEEFYVSDKRFSKGLEDGVFMIEGKKYKKKYSKNKDYFERPFSARGVLLVKKIFECPLHREGMYYAGDNVIIFFEKKNGKFVIGFEKYGEDDILLKEDLNVDELISFFGDLNENLNGEVDFYLDGDVVEKIKNKVIEGVFEEVKEAPEEKNGFLFFKK